MPRTIVDDPRKTMSFYDQIAWFQDKKGEDLITLKPGRAGTFPFHEHVLTGRERHDLSFRLSDHLPLWVELGL